MLKSPIGETNLLTYFHQSVIVTAPPPQTTTRKKSYVAYSSK